MTVQVRSARTLCRVIAAGLTAVLGLALVFHAALAAGPTDRKIFIIAAQRNAPPFSFAGRDGEPQGVLVEFWQLWATRNGHEIRFYLADLDETIEAVRSGRADFHSGLFYSDPRSEYLDFSSGFLDDTLSLFVLDKLNVQSISDLGATPILVGASRDHYAAEYIQHNYPLLRLKLYPNNEDVVMSALRNELVAFAVDYPVAFYFLSKYDARGQFRVVTDLATHELRAAIRKGNREILDIVESGLGNISKEDIAALSDKWGLREKRLFPPWLIRAIVGGAVGFLFIALLVNGYLLKREVRRKTRELNDKNRILNLINRDMLAASQTVQGQIEALEKLGRDKDEILGIVAEGLRSPIQGIAERTQGGASPAEKEIHDQTEKMIRLIDRLMEASRMETESYAQELTRTDLVKLLDSKRAAFRQMAEMKDISFEMTLPAEPLWVFVHPKHFGEICDNLFLNAVKFSHPGGNIRIRAWTEGAEDDKKALLSFQDRGIGIPEAQIPLLFKRFSGTAREGTSGEPSTGLGLFLVKRVLDLHGGTIRVESTVGEGSTFTVELPVFEERVREYDDIEVRLQTGDIVLFKGLYINRMGEKSVAAEWTHLGVVVRIPGTDEPLLWESTPLETIPDRQLRRPKKGAQLVSLRERLGTYETSVYAARYLKTARTPEMTQALYGFIYEVHGLPFPKDFQVIRKVIHGRLFRRWWARKTRFKSIFCSELVAESYMRMGLLPEAPPSSAYMPVDFSSARRLPLLRGAALGNEIMVRVQNWKPL
jgi:signal transduction histidine kinase